MQISAHSGHCTRLLVKGDMANTQPGFGGLGRSTIHHPHTQRDGANI